MSHYVSGRTKWALSDVVVVLKALLCAILSAECVFVCRWCACISFWMGFDGVGGDGVGRPTTTRLQSTKQLTNPIWDHYFWSFPSLFLSASSLHSHFVSKECFVRCYYFCADSIRSFLPSKQLCILSIVFLALEKDNTQKIDMLWSELNDKRSLRSDGIYQNSDRCKKNPNENEEKRSQFSFFLLLFKQTLTMT